MTDWDIKRFMWIWVLVFAPSAVAHLVIPLLARGVHRMPPRVADVVESANRLLTNPVGRIAVLVYDAAAVLYMFQHVHGRLQTAWDDAMKGL